MTQQGGSQRDLPSAESGPYLLQPLLEEVPLSEDGSKGDVKINCVEYYDGNLYIGTSASELLHLVQIPPDPADKNGKPMYISASRLAPPYHEINGGTCPGVQQILLLPRAGKACILCNSTVTFYSLPELTPVFESTQVKNCSWIGGIDLNEPITNEGTRNEPEAMAILMSLKKKIQVVRIGDNARPVKNIDFAASCLSVRRDTIACVADSKVYALLDVDKQLKIPLMNISSLEPPASPEPPAPSGKVDIGGISRSASTSHAARQSVSQSHARSSSLGGAILGNLGRQQDQVGGASRNSSSPDQPGTPQSGLATDKALPDVPSEARQSSDMPRPAALQPHIASPTPDEFLIVTGTTPEEVGIGMFINLDGEITRPTISFEKYPEQVVVDGGTANLASSRSGLSDDDDGYVLASLDMENREGSRFGIEIQRVDAGSEAHPEKHWLFAANLEPNGPYGIQSLLGNEDMKFEEIVKKLSEKRFSSFPSPTAASVASLKSLDSRTASSMERLSKEQELFERNSDSQDDDLPDGWETSRVSEGEEFARRLAKVSTTLVAWSDDKIWWTVRNPLILQLENALGASNDSQLLPGKLDTEAVFGTVARIRRREAKTELEFMTFRYMRQKAGILLLGALLLAPPHKELTDAEISAMEEIFADSQLDPRVVLSMIPGIRNEIIEGRNGIWIYGGVKKITEMILCSDQFEAIAKNSIGNLESRTLHFLRRFLSAWRKMKGFGSVPDEREVFRTVEAALLLVLLELDRRAPKALGRHSPIKIELHELVDKGVDCFDRAVDILESHHRLFILSRLYQSRKMAGDVLATWRRIIEGERDDGQEFQDGELRIKDYLSKISNQSLVKEYGVWLARRNPKLGVEIFAEDKSKAAKFEPAQVVEMLRNEAPMAVKHFLEHLTFGKGHTAYINELIFYYLDSVIGDLEASEASRDAVMVAYATYRALEAPKPTYHHFLMANTSEDNEVWQNRLRLLQLLGGANDYNTSRIRQRISRLSGDLLVPETIILAGRESHHEQALRLLVHKLGDYDSAVSYCLRGGASVFSTPEGTPSRRRRGGDAAASPSAEDQQRLFRAVLREFLAIDDASERVEQTGALLERFGGWFDLDEVLHLVPDGWSVDVVAGFLVGALRRLVRERHEARVASALSGAQNLRVSHDLITTIEGRGPTMTEAEQPAEAA
ncbi:Vacuolar sorting protein [Cordyceps fumosorosea ARSEF 2679]|uniref:Vacuolar sorting protein n=1 Tax=Cordyceps fumosorosea (strain ARSEF 2679) TaxID=1081104 RepID=A0A162MSD6_CORFA|nr:Vacuolar sorting protein [Cordyceps fumosorosea ARSEF 2679]OAA66180.1 Vacuolar sorting protein [Cordyceps fumosorosea ARSEF 2679]